MSKYFDEKKNLTYEDFVNLMTNELNIKNFPNVQKIEGLDDSFWIELFGMTKEELLQNYESLKNEMSPEEFAEAEKLFFELEKFSDGVLYTTGCDMDVNYNVGKKIKDIDNLDNNLIEVDLGLRTEDGKKILFADRNLFANNPNDVGGYFQWGSLEGVIDKITNVTKFGISTTTPQLIRYLYISGAISNTNEIKAAIALLSGLISEIPFDKDNYKYYDGVNYTKYNSSDSLTILQPEDDVTRLIGGGWEMPSVEIMHQLLSNIKGSANDTIHPLSATFKIKHKETGIIEYKPGYYKYISIRDKHNSTALTHNANSLVVDDVRNVADNYNVMGVTISNEKLNTSIYLPLNSFCYGAGIFGMKECGYWTTHAGTAKPSLEIYDNPLKPYPIESCAIAYDFFGGYKTTSVAVSRDNTHRCEGRHIRPVKIID